MPSFSAQSFTGKAISQSYQRVMQAYIPPGATNYLLDGTGSVIFSFPSGSYGGQLVTSDQTGSSAFATSASWASHSIDSLRSISSSWASQSLSSSFATSASYAPFNQTLQVSASWASQSLSSSFSLVAVSSSYALSSSFSVNAQTKLPISGGTLVGDLIISGSQLYVTGGFIETDGFLANVKDNITTAAPVAAEFYHHTVTGTPAVGDGVSIDFSLDTATTLRQTGGRITATWTSASAGGRTGQFRFFLPNSASFNEAFRFGPITANFSGSVTAVSFTGSVSGSVTSASYASTASVLLGSVTSASYALSGSNSISSSYSGTSSVLLGSVVSASYAGTASVLLGAVTSASYALSSSYALLATTAGTATTATTATSATSATTAATASYISSSATFDVGKQYVLTASNASTASVLLGSVTSASYAGTASVLLGSVTSASYALTSSNALVSSIVVGTLTTINYVATMSIDFNASMFHSSSISSSLYLTASNLGPVKMASIKIFASGSNCNLYFPTTWTWFCTTPTLISASKTAVVSLTSYGTTDSNIYAVFAMQP